MNVPSVSVRKTAGMATTAQRLWNLSASRYQLYSESPGWLSSTSFQTYATLADPTSTEPSGPHRIPKAPSGPKRVSLAHLRKLYLQNKPITMLTAYDYPSAVHADLAGMDIVLVGDSVGMVELGLDTTQFVTMDMMIHHCRAVHAGARRPFVIGDMPFGSYEISKEKAMENAYRFVKEGFVNAVKLEGGTRVASTVKAIVESGIAVMGHTGLTPQSVSALGGFRAQGQTFKEARTILDDALALQQAGVFGIVLECVPERLAQRITQILSVPTIGIGAGRWTSGQVLVYHDMVGMLTHPHHAKVTPKFCKKYAHVGEYVHDAIEAYRDEVKARQFPGPEFSPYSIPDPDWEDFVAYSKSFEKPDDLQSSMTQQEAASPKSSCEAGPTPNNKTPEKPVDGEIALY